MSELVMQLFVGMSNKREKSFNSHNLSCHEQISDLHSNYITRTRFQIKKVLLLK